MKPELRQQGEYSSRQVEAAHRVLVDVGQVLASFRDCLVVVGGWVPDLLMPDAPERHIGSIDVDLAVDADRLREGRYAEMLKQLLATGRYKQGPQPFQLVTEVDLGDGEGVVVVEVDFLASKDVRLDKHRPKLLPGFRVLQTRGCETAFRAPVEVEVSGQMVRGAKNTVAVRVAAVADALVMKAMAIDNRDKPKDVYDLCYCLENDPHGIEALAEDWKIREKEENVRAAKEILRQKFAEIDSFGPQQVVEFLAAADEDERAIQARRAFEIVQRFLNHL